VYKLELEEKELNVVYQALAKLPAELVMQLLIKIESQYKTQKAELDKAKREG